MFEVSSLQLLIQILQSNGLNKIENEEHEQRKE